MITYNEQSKRFAVITEKSSYFMCIDEDMRLRHLYYGERIENPDEVTFELPFIKGILKPGTHFPFKAEYITKEKTQFLEPCLFSEFEDGTRDCQLIYKSHSIEKTPDGEKLSIVLCDRFYKIEVVLNYVIYNGLNLISKNTVIKNTGEKSIKLTKMKSGTMYPEWNRPMRLMHMAGRWGAEYQKKYMDLTQGKFTIDNTRGNCATHQHVPFFAIDEGDATETKGNVWFGLLHWSGDFRIDFELNYDNQLVVSAGVNDFDVCVELKENEEFETPLFTMGFVSSGYEEMSRELYDYQYDFLLPQTKIKKEFPIIYNTWYPYELEVNEEKCLGFIEKAKYIGAELFVIDDGWFGRRKDLTDGLGDWWCDKDKFPNGLKPVADKCHSMGMKFGLWVEPEMVNKKSDLYKEHPEWVLSFPNRENTQIRNQCVLDLSRDDVMEFVWETVDKLISDYDLDYVKWDMNSYVTETTVHSRDMRVKYIKNLYEVWRRMNEKYPDVLFENCAAGGSRADYGMAPYSDRINRSDNSDPVDVLKIHEGFSTYILPRLAGGAGNVATCPHHLNGRIVPLKYRAHLGMTGSMSVGINLLKASKEEIEEIRYYVEEYKKVRHIAQDAYLYRLSSVYTSNVAVWEYLKRDRKSALVFMFANGMNFRDSVPRVKLRGLSKDKLYKVTGEYYKIPETFMEAPKESYMHGDALMNFGIRIEPMGDYDSLVLRVEEVE